MGYAQRMLLRATLLLVSFIAGVVVAGLPVGLAAEILFKAKNLNTWTYLAMLVGGVWSMAHHLDLIVSVSKEDPWDRVARATAIALRRARRIDEKGGD